jgi:hypothetical protein
MQLDLLAYARTADPETCRLSARDRTTDRARALAVLQGHPDGLTDFELADAMGSIQTSAGKRRHELMVAGLVEYAGHTRLSPSGSPARVWRLR